MRESVMASPVDPVVMMSTALPLLWSEPGSARRPPYEETSGNSAQTARYAAVPLGVRPDSMSEETEQGSPETPPPESPDSPESDSDPDPPAADAALTSRSLAGELEDSSGVGVGLALMLESPAPS